MGERRERSLLHAANSLWRERGNPWEADKIVIITRFWTLWSHSVISIILLWGWLCFVLCFVMPFRDWSNSFLFCFVHWGGISILKDSMHCRKWYWIFKFTLYTHTHAHPHAHALGKSFQVPTEKGVSCWTRRPWVTGELPLPYPNLGQQAGLITLDTR